jgi:hypothetical protein
MQLFSWLFRAKPRYGLEQVLTAIGSVVSWEALKGRGVNAHRGAGDAMGIGILVSLGAALILLGLGTALACTVTYVIHLPLRSDAENAIEPQEVEDATEPQEAVRSKRVRRAWWPFGQRV